MSCLFNSLSYFIDLNSTQLRNKICDYLQTNPTLIDDMKASDVIKFDSNLTLDKYIQRMRSISTWGGAIEIRAFCNLYNKNVIVKNIRNQRRVQNNNNLIEFLAIPSKPLNREKNDEFNCHITWSGGHYEPIRK